MKKLFSALVIVLLFAASFSLYSSFYGNPIRLHQTKAQIELYLSTTYPGVTFTNVTTSYNPKFHTYGGGAIAHLDVQINVAIDQFRKGEFTDNLVNQKLAKEARTELLPIVRSIFPSLDSLDMWLSWDTEAMKYELDTAYSRYLPLTMGLDIQWQGPDTTKDEFLDSVLLCHQTLTTKGFTTSSYTFAYKFSDQVYTLHLQNPNNPRAMLLDDVRQGTK